MFDEWMESNLITRALFEDIGPRCEVVTPPDPAG